MCLLNSRLLLNEGDKKQCERPRILCRGEVEKSERWRNDVTQREEVLSQSFAQHRTNPAIYSRAAIFFLLLASYLSVESFYRVPETLPTALKLSLRAKGQAQSCHCVPLCIVFDKIQFAASGQHFTDCCMFQELKHLLLWCHLTH